MINYIEEARQVIKLEIDSLIAMMERLDESFIRACTILSESNKVITAGVGKSGMIGRKIAATLSSIGLPSVFLHPVEALHGDIGIIQKGDSVILLSKSGNTEEIITLIPYIKSRKASIIAITGNPDSYLSRAADVSLDASVEAEACPFNLAPTTSTTAALVMGDALAVACMKIREVSLEDFSLTHPQGQIGRNISLQVRDVMHKNEHLAWINPEAAFKDALIEISNKKLGCVCILDSNKKLIGIITDGDVRRILQIRDNIGNISAAEVMTTNPVSINEDAFLNDALLVMENRDSQISALPVINSAGECVGLIRTHDILRSGF
ncbi:MAG: KpsF/GutQ family sugar-phosphate isomerase [Candidatus Kapabacteria bacterium]|nr:KpsF/GutQ family sugar-phosphate isomerase [Candidatus Kapabacteria bacterium]